MGKPLSQQEKQRVTECSVKLLEILDLNLGDNFYLKVRAIKVAAVILGEDADINALGTIYSNIPGGAY